MVTILLGKMIAVSTEGTVFVKKKVNNFEHKAIKCRVFA
jgi:hypothetical protein